MAVLIIPSFVFWGIATDSSGGALPKTAGHLDSKKIKTEVFIDHYNALRRELQMFHGIGLDQSADQIDLQALVWQRILLVHAASKAGIKISDQQVIEWARNQEFFQEEGQFSAARYNAIMQRFLQIDPLRFEENMRQYLALQEYKERIRESAAVTDEEVKDKYNARYAARDLDYIIITEDHLIEKPEVTPAEIQQNYERLAARLFTPAGIKVRMIELSTEEETLTADENTLFETKAVNTGYFSIDDAIPGIGEDAEMTKAIFSLAEISDRTEWLPHDDAFYKFELLAKRPFSRMSLEDASEILKSDIYRGKVQSLIAQKAQDHYSVMTGASFEDVVEDEEFEVHSVQNHKFGDYMDKVGALEYIDRNLENLKAGEISSPIPTSNGAAIFKVVRIGEVAEDRWEELKDSIRSEVKLAKEIAAFEQKLEELQSHLQINSKTMRALFSSQQVEVDHTGHNHD